MNGPYAYFLVSVVDFERDQKSALLAIVITAVEI